MAIMPYHVVLKLSKQITGKEELLNLSEARNLALEILKAIGYDEKFEQALPRIENALKLNGYEVKGVQYEPFADFMDYQDLESIMMWKLNFDAEGLMYNSHRIDLEHVAECNCYYGLEDGILTFVKHTEP